jgi:hypothetical protein
MATKTFPVGLTEEKRAEYQAAADKEGVSLAQWIRDSCDLRLGNVVVRGQAETHVQNVAVASDLRVFRGPDQKPSQRNKK